MESEREEGSTSAETAPGRCVRVTGVELRVVGGSLVVKREVGRELDVTCQARNRLCSVHFHRGEDVVYQLDVRASTSVYSADSNVLLFRATEGSVMAVFSNSADATRLLDHMHRHLNEKTAGGKTRSVFNHRTEEASAKQYFQFYGYLSQQQNMMQDYIRTSTFQTAILHNLMDFKGKVVLDVGAGTGVLSFFALQGGARKVYAVEASNMSRHCSKLVEANKFSDRMKVIAGKIEEVELPEEVDVIVSEPMGYMLFNERMLETYLHAKKWLKPGGKMYPTQGILYVAPFSDEALYLEQMGKSYFWQQKSFHGVDVSVLHAEAVTEYFRQPIVDTFDIRILMSRPIGHTTDFSTAKEEELHMIEIPLNFKTWTTGYMHGLAFWFDVAFIGAQTTVWLSTAPFQPLTHWYQVRLLLKQPLYVEEGHTISGLVKMVANERQSYDIMASVRVVETNQQSSGTYDLKNPNFRYMTTPQAPPGSLHSNPTETFFDSQSASAAAGTVATAASTEQRTPLLSMQPHPQVMRVSAMQSVGALQAGSDVIPIANGSIITPTVQQSPGGGGLQLGSSDQSYMQYTPRQGQQWGTTGLHSMQTPSHMTAYQHGVDFGAGHGMGTLPYGMGTLAQHVHISQPHVVSSISSGGGGGGGGGGGLLYQPKWPTQQTSVLQAVASHS